MGRRRRTHRRERQMVSWYPVVGNLSNFVVEGTLAAPSVGVIATLDTTPFVEHEAVLERSRGSLFVSGEQTGTWQGTVTGMILPKKFTEQTEYPNAWNVDDGTDYFLYESWACIDNNVIQSMRMVDSKAKRRIEVGDVLRFHFTGRVLQQSVNKQLNIGLNLRCLFRFA